MIKINKATNLLEQDNYRYTLQDVPEPNLYRDFYSYSGVPKVSFNHRHVPLNTPKNLYITDTTFRDGQQSREPYTVDQMVTLYDLLHRLGGEKGIIRQSEFFVYSEKDRLALQKCMERGYDFPECTTWIRATKGDFELVKSIGVKETGILVSASDYHIFKKMKLTRAQAADQYLSVVRQALAMGIVPRCHLEDITRADFYGFVVPFVTELMKLSKEANIPIKVRACDTMGYGVTYPGTVLPRSVQGIVYGLNYYAGVPSEMLEWHGHNDFYKGVVNGTTAWLYGASSVNCSLLGIGERTGNIPTEAMVFEYASLRGTLNGMDPTVITEIAEYYRKELGYTPPSNMPYVGRNFNVTRAGIHADGLLKDDEIYNIFDTKALLNRPPLVAVTNVSGLAGIAHWINSYLDLSDEDKVDKKSDFVAKIKDWVDAEYDGGRVSLISDHELLELVRQYAPQLLEGRL